MEKGGRKRERKIWYSIVWIEWKWREENLIFHCLLDFHPASPFLSLSKLGIKYQKRWWLFFSFLFPLQVKQFFYFIGKIKQRLLLLSFLLSSPFPNIYKGSVLFSFSPAFFSLHFKGNSTRSPGVQMNPLNWTKIYYYNIFYFLFPVLTLKIKIWTL